MAAGCRPQGTTLEEVMNMRKLGKYAMAPEIEQTQEETIQRFQFLQREVTLVDNVYYLFQKAFKVAKRVSETAKRKVGLREQSVNEDNEIKRQMGTQVHACLRDIMEYYANGIGTLGEIRNKYITGDYKIGANHFERLRLLVNETIESIKEQQKRIDPKGEVKIFTEQFVMDFKKDVGGTLDVIALFSDNTASIYDYKTTSESTTRGRNPIGWGSKGYEVKETVLPYYDTRAYDISMSEYSRILLEKIGVKSVRQNRLLPVALKFKAKPKDERTETSNIVPELATLIAGSEMSEHLKPIPVGGERSKWEGINKLLEKQYNLLNKLNKKLSNRSITTDERHDIQQHIQRIEKTIKSTLVDENTLALTQTIADLITRAHTRLNEPETLENGEVNPAYPTIDELQNILAEMDTYHSVIAETHLYFEDIKKEDESKYETLKKELFNVFPLYQSVHAAVKLELGHRIAPVVGKEWINEEGYLKPFRELGFADLQSSKISAIDNPLFQGAWHLIRDAQYEQKQAFNKMDKEVWEATEELWKWAKVSGRTRQEAYDMMINPKTGNLYARLDSKFYEKVRIAQETKDPDSIAFLKSSYEMRDKEAWKKEYNERLEGEKGRLKAKYNNFEETKTASGRILRTVDEQKKDYEKEMAYFVERFNLLASEKAWLNPGNLRRYCKIKDDVLVKNYSEEYKKIVSIPAMSRYYDVWHKYMNEFSNILGITDFKVLPDNFIPNIRKEMAEHVTRDSFNYKAAFREFIDSFSVREEDIYISNIDENGERTQIPVLFVNKFRDKDGKIDNTRKSYELSSSLMVFGKMAYNYKYMSQIEPKINALKILMGDPSPEHGGIESTDKFHNRIKGKIQPFLTKDGRMTETYKLFQDITDYYLYGIKFKDKSFIKGIDTTHLLTKSKNFNAALKLGFAFIPAAGALTAGHMGLYIMGKKGISYTSDQLNDAVQDMVLHRKEANTMCAFFDPYNDDYTDREFQKYKTTWKNKSLDRFLFAFLRRADVSITRKAIIAMSKNYGIDEDGGIIRLNKPGVDASKYKTICESIGFDKDGNFEIQGLKKDGFIQFVAAVRSTMGGIIGNMNPDDIGRPDVGLIQNQFFAFRSWMPEVVAERLGKLKYDENVDSLKWGRFRSYLSEYSYKAATEELRASYNVSEQEFQDGKAISMYITHVLVPNISKLILDISTFGLAPKLGMKRTNEVRAQWMFNKWLDENPHLKGKVDFQQYLEIKEGQMKAMLVEIRMILSFLTLALFLGGTGDDGERRYTHVWPLRVAYKTLSKAGSELTFMWNPDEFLRLMKNPWPLTGLLTQVQNTLKNTFDETRDFIAGENSSRDMTPPMYYTLQWMKGGPQTMRFFEVYKGMAKNTYAVFGSPK